MSGAPYLAESSGTVPAWQNQVAHSYSWGPSGVRELFFYGIMLIVLMVSF